MAHGKDTYKYACTSDAHTDAKRKRDGKDIASININNRRKLLTAMGW